MPKFTVRYKVVTTYEGTIEADTVQDAENRWDEGYTPEDEKEVDRGSEEIIHWE